MFFYLIISHYMHRNHRHLFHTWATLSNKTRCFISKGGLCMKQVLVTGIPRTKANFYIFILYANELVLFNE